MLLVYGSNHSSVHLLKLDFSFLIPLAMEFFGKDLSELYSYHPLKQVAVVYLKHITVDVNSQLNKSMFALHLL